MIKWILTKIVGTKNQREVRRLRPIVEQIVSIEESWNGKGQEFLLSPYFNYTVPFQKGEERGEKGKRSKKDAPGWGIMTKEHLID